MPKDLPQVAQSKDIATISKEKFLRLYAPSNCLKHALNLKNIEDVLQRKSVGISQMKRAFGQEFARAFLMVWLVHLNEILALNKPMKETQIEYCAEYILQEYYFFSFVELSFVFHKIISGQYGEFYESLTPAKLLTFFRDYCSERMQTAQEMTLREHYEFRYQEQKNETHSDSIMRGLKKMYR